MRGRFSGSLKISLDGPGPVLSSFLLFFMGSVILGRLFLYGGSHSPSDIESFDSRLV